MEANVCPICFSRYLPLSTGENASAAAWRTRRTADTAPPTSAGKAGADLGLWTCIDLEKVSRFLAYREVISVPYQTHVRKSDVKCKLRCAC